MRIAAGNNSRAAASWSRSSVIVHRSSVLCTQEFSIQRRYARIASGAGASEIWSKSGRFFLANKLVITASRLALRLLQAFTVNHGLGSKWRPTRARTIATEYLKHVSQYFL